MAIKSAFSSAVMLLGVEFSIDAWAIDGGMQSMLFNQVKHASPWWCKGHARGRHLFSLQIEPYVMQTQSLDDIYECVDTVVWEVSAIFTHIFRKWCTSDVADSASNSSHGQNSYLSHPYPWTWSCAYSGSLWPLDVLSQRARRLSPSG